MYNTCFENLFVHLEDQISNFLLIFNHEVTLLFSGAVKISKDADLGAGLLIRSDTGHVILTRIIPNRCTPFIQCQGVFFFFYVAHNGENNLILVFCVLGLKKYITDGVLGTLIRTIVLHVTFIP